MGGGGGGGKDGFGESLGLAVCLKTGCRGRYALDSEYGAYCCKEFAYKLGFNVDREIRRYAVWNKPAVREQIHKVFGCRFQFRDSPR